MIGLTDALLFARVPGDSRLRGLIAALRHWWESPFPGADEGRCTLFAHSQLDRLLGGGFQALVETGSPETACRVIDCAVRQADANSENPPLEAPFWVFAIRDLARAGRTWLELESLLEAAALSALPNSASEIDRCWTRGIGMAKAGAPAAAAEYWSATAKSLRKHLEQSAAEEQALREEYEVWGEWAGRLGLQCPASTPELPRNETLTELQKWRDGVVAAHVRSAFWRSQVGFLGLCGRVPLTDAVSKAAMHRFRGAAQIGLQPSMKDLAALTKLAMKSQEELLRRVPKDRRG